MKQYHYLQNNQQLGPVTLEELKTKNITKETMIWTQGMADWEKAGEVAEVAEIFAIAGTAAAPTPQAPAYGQPQNYQQQQQYHQPQAAYGATIKSKAGVWIVLSIVGILLIGGGIYGYTQGWFGQSYNFQPYSSNIGFFTVNAPNGQMDLQQQNFNIDGNSVTQYIHIHDAGDAAFMVSHMNLPYSDFTDSEVNTILNESANGFVNEFNGTITSNTPVQQNGYPGIKVTATGNSQIYDNNSNPQTMQILSETILFLAGNRLFIVGVYGEQGKLKQKSIDDFLGSFSLMTN